MTQAFEAFDHTPRVLLAEDHPGPRQLAELLLRQTGAVVTAVQNGLEAVDAFASQSFDLILMDVRMPAMGGVAAIRAIRRQEAAELRPRTPIYALTAKPEAEELDAASRAGADAWLAKPFTAQALAAAVRESGRLQALAPMLSAKSA